MNVTLTQAETVIAAAKRVAAERDEKVSLAVVDSGGNPVAFARGDGTALITIDTAIGKAFTAVTLGFDTTHVTPHIQPGQALFGTGLTLAGPRSFVPYGGGVLITVDGETIGALGVSGAASSDTDHEIGVAAVAQLG
ncbi:GlcG/HbpS family heme-binding protein [Nocardia stercoris]|uniref:GlcG/HbpS family heme-binding protein n=1 Tax=Nocardia stercoris TaxID=2483361 RepID=UPI00131A39BF|nr:heme-binding protein [Nocardia stercoris]